MLRISLVLKMMQHTHALALTGRRMPSWSDSDGGSASKTDKSVRANLSHTLPTAAIATANLCAGDTGSIHSDTQCSRPGLTRAAEPARGGGGDVGGQKMLVQTVDSMDVS